MATNTPASSIDSYNTSTAKSKVRRKSDGLVFERWAIDANDLVSTGEHEYAFADVPSVRERLEAMSREQVAALLVPRNTGNANLEHLVALALPLIEEGTITFQEAA